MDFLSARLRETAQPEKLLYGQGYRHVAGVDEAGRGPLAGPVVAAAVIMPSHWGDPEVKDSKKLTPRKRAALYQRIGKQALTWNWALVEPDEIDRINILQASLTAMRKSVETLSLTPEYIIIDGPYPLASHLPQTSITKGDAKSPIIAAASIMAKVVRDSIMLKHHNLFPCYNFAGHKGYGTREHRKALAAYGDCPIHRKSFRR